MIANNPPEFYTPTGDRALTLVEVDSLGRLDEQRYFTLAERSSWERGKRRWQYLGGRLAAKQSILSYLPELSWPDVEIRRLPHGAPAVALSDRGQMAASHIGIKRWLLSISHTDRYAVAWAIATKTENC